MLIEGFRELRLALLKGIEIESIYYCPELLDSKKTVILANNFLNQAKLVFETNLSVFSKIAFGERKEGVIGIARQRRKTLGDLTVGKDSILVVVENIEKPGNLGAIMRTCDAAGIKALIACNCPTDIYNPNCIRASLGACFCLDCFEATTEETISWLKQKNIKLILATPEAKSNYWQVCYKRPCAIIFGSEDKGLSADFKSASELKIGIPMFGKVDSLNVSASVAIVVYEALRQIQSNL